MSYKQETYALHGIEGRYRKLKQKINFEFKWSVKIVSVSTVVQVGMQSLSSTGRVREIFRSPD